MRITRDQYKRFHKKLSPHKKAVGCGWTCWICNPKSVGKAAKQNARNKADLRHMQGLE
jgi:aryl-phospho-beta-D-glucosidase BglC (GH1 family)